MEELKNIKSPRILVVGEFCIDEYIYGDVNRISPEAPIPVVEKTKVERRIGMAGNVVKNLIALGAKVTFITLEGREPEIAFNIKDFFKENGIEDFATLRTSRQTIMKTRIVSGKHQMIRIDSEDTDPIPFKAQQHFESLVLSKIEEYDSLLIQDYGKGLFTRGMTSSIIREFIKRNKMVFIDPNPKNDLSYYEYCTLLKPNKKEAIKLIDKVGYKVDQEDESRVLDLLQKATGARYIVMTDGANGMIGMDTDKEAYIYLPAKDLEVVDVTGAGDTVIAILTFLMSQNYSLSRAMECANIGASIAVKKFGTVSVTWQEIISELLTKSCRNSDK